MEKGIKSDRILAKEPRKSNQLRLYGGFSICYFMAMNQPVTFNKKTVFLFSFFLDGLILDQLSKWLLSQYLTAPLEIIPGVFRLQLEQNSGIAFSIALPFPLLITLNLLLFGAIVWYLLRHLNLNRWLAIVPLALLAAGAVGNLIDRLRLGYVVDFISVGSFPVFNLADAYITVSIFLIVLFYDKIKRPT
jgi:signal peptidase II